MVILFWLFDILLSQASHESKRHSQSVHVHVIFVIVIIKKKQSKIFIWTIQGGREFIPNDVYKNDTNFIFNLMS